MHIERFKKNYKDYSLGKETVTEIEKLARTGGAYNRLSASIAPEIFGCDDIKKALLLMMVGAPTRRMKDGMKIRGDINICLMGDPGVAKSQLLKHISVIAPRGVYTSGKGSSGVGLTAAVLRDPLTNDLVLEGGSLVLADKGICCIDEFDKMEDSDRTAIHEVMEQQTISIAKAGITTTLNARTAILAAANPAFGRYNIRKTASENINLPAALLSRFDLLFLLLDKPNMEKDLNLAKHVTFVHMFWNQKEILEQAKEENQAAYPSEFIRSYISQARQYQPTVPEGLTEYIVNAYVNMRNQKSSFAKGENQYTTARTLLALLRLSVALARIRFDTEVTQEDVDEAMRLMHSSKISLLEEQDRKGYVDPISSIFDILRNAATQPSNTRRTVTVADITPKVLASGFTTLQFDECIRAYEALGVLRVDASKTEIFFSM